MNLRILAVITLAASSLQAQPSVCSVINDALASALTPGIRIPVCPGYASVVAQGSIISVTGTGLGPDVEASDAEFPLRTSLAGASLRLTVGGTVVEAFVLNAQQNRIRAIVPSRTPAGEAVLVVTHDGVTSAPYKVRVVERQFHVYHRGTLALAQNVDPDGSFQANDFTAPARPGQTLTLWGTGLGPVDGDEGTAPAPSSLSGAGVDVLLGLQPARVLYAGRSSCCAGLDQIVIETPSGIEGCTVPVIVRPQPEDPAGAFPHVSIASRGSCSDPHGMSESVRQRVATNGGGRIGSVLLGQYGWSQDGLSANFTRFGNRFVVPAGACGYPPSTYSPDRHENDYWGAGPELKLDGPFGELAAVEDLDDYNNDFGSFYQSSSAPGDLGPGTYTIHNEEGGRDVGPFRFTFPIGSPFEWTNRSGLNSVQTGKDVTLTWAAGDMDDGYVAINGTFLTFAKDPNGYGLGGFTCLERAGKGSFTVPEWMVWTNRVAAAEVLELQVQHYRRQEFTAPGLDYGEFLHASKAESQRAVITGR